MKLLKFTTAMCRLTLLTMSVMALSLLVIVELSNATDVTAPQLQSLSIAPTTIDVSTQSQTISFTAHITDNTGFNWGLITITSPSGNQSSSANAVFSSGNPLDGVWIFSIAIPKAAETGTWKVTRILLQDSDGNNSSFTEAQGIQVTGAADTTPPQLQSLSIAPSTVDVSTRSQTINFTARITDNLAGVNWGLITITSPSGNQSSSANAVFSSGNSLDGVWIFPVTIPKAAETGIWKVTRILLQDSAGNNSSFTETQGIQVTGTEDVTAPQLQSLSIAPTTVDVSTRSQTINFTAHITDNLAGVNWGLITITSPSGSQSSSANAVFSSGNSLDGVWVFSIAIPKAAETGTWKVTQILLQDSAGNNSSFTETQGIQVTGTEDVTAPQLQSLSIAPTTVDVSTQSQTINFTARITDNLAGFNWGLMTITSPSGKQSSSANAVFSSGNSLDGVWIFSIAIPKAAETGTWKVTQILLQDSAGNNASFTEAQGIQVTGAADITPPQLQSLSIAPTTVDVRTQSQTINFTARITDNLAGFNWGLMTITSPSGSQSSAANAVFSSGNSLDGVWVFPITIPKAAETGTWKVTQILLQDSDGNNASFTEAQGIQVTGAADTTPPQLQSLSIAPTTVDVSTQSQTINFIARITDNLAGVSWGLMTITSPSGNQSSSANAVFSSGNSLDGVWVFSITIPKSSEIVTWKVTQILLQDSAGNNASFTEARGIQVIGPDTLSPTLTIFSLENGATTHNPTLNISGAVTDSDGVHSLIINNIMAPVTGDTFSTNITLKLGANTITTVATDTLGNQSTDTRTITLFPQPGDLNLNGSVDIADAILSLQVLSRMTPAEAVYKEADINNDNRIGMAEVIYTLQKAAGMR